MDLELMGAFLGLQQRRTRYFSSGKLQLAAMKEEIILSTVGES
jgi:hypothetical protein